MRAKLLWAEDQHDFVAALEPALGVLGMEIVHAPDADSAWQQFVSKGPWALVIVDLQMEPGQWGGLELLQRLRDYLQDVPAIVLSGAGTLSECISAVRLGARDYVQKERALDELVSTATRVLEAAAQSADISDYQRVVSTERRLHAIVLSELRSVAVSRGDPDVFRHLVPSQIALKTYQRMLEAGSGRQEDYLDLIDLREIIDKNWQLSGFQRLETLTKPRSKDERTRWIARLNEARKVVAHPVRGSLSDDQRRDIRRAWEIMNAWAQAVETN